MVVDIITRHAISNYGSLLQSIATQTVVKELGYENKIIDYIRDDEDYRNIVDVLLEQNKKWNSNFLRRFIYKCIQTPEFYLMGKKFEVMRQKHLITTKRCSSHKDLSLLSKDADIFITGSDQVWGPIGNDTYDSAYFLDFVDSKKKIISYAASFGRANLDDFNRKQFSSLLTRYNCITVREKSAEEIVREMGFNNVQRVIDPTLLLAKNQWEKYMNKKSRREYVLIYQLHSNKEMDKYAKEFAKRAKLPLLRVTPTLHQFVRSGRICYLPDMGEFLGLIHNAKYLITDSFHGTAFAINFNTQFINVLSGKKHVNQETVIEKTSTRNQSILELTNLTNRILKDFNDFSYIDEMIDFSKVNPIIEEERTKSIGILKKMLEGN